MRSLSVRTRGRVPRCAWVLPAALVGASCVSHGRPAPGVAEATLTSAFSAASGRVDLTGVSVGMPYAALRRLRPAARPRPGRGRAEVYGVDSLVFHFADGEPRTPAELLVPWIEPADSASLQRIDFFRRVATDCEAWDLWQTYVARLRSVVPAAPACVHTRTQTGGHPGIEGAAALVRQTTRRRTPGDSGTVLWVSIVPSHDELLRDASGGVLERWRVPAVVGLSLGPPWRPPAEVTGTVSCATAEASVR
jgi:hypothetical protein